MRNYKKSLSWFLILNVICSLFFVQTTTNKNEVNADQGGIPIYRLYNPNTGEHLHTMNDNERAFLVLKGWYYEGISMLVSNEGRELYRLYNRNTGEHFYTLNDNERANLQKHGWSYEGVAWRTPWSGVPMYRVYNPNANNAGSHHYTISEYERDNLLRHGWRNEGIAWYTLGTVSFSNLTKEEQIKEYISRMSIDQRIGQTLIVDLYTLNNSRYSTQITNEQIQNIRTYNIGGVAFFGQNVSNGVQVQSYIDNLQKNSRLPLFISVDEEGGSVSRVGGKNGTGVPVFPNMSSIGATGQTGQAYAVGSQLGGSLKRLGFNLNFAPVSDVNTNPNNPVIGVRAFSNNQHVAAQMVAAEVSGLQDQNVSATLKHFPGHGDTSVDSHTDMPVSYASYDRLKQVEFVPFTAGMNAGADFVMMSHVNMRGITNNNLPASMSRQIVTGMLRNDMNFSKLIITDSLQMGAITKNFSRSEIGINCLRAGVDVLLMPQDIPQTIAGIKAALNSGTYSEAELNQTLYRILKMKVDRGIIPIEKLKV